MHPKVVGNGISAINNIAGPKNPWTLEWKRFNSKFAPEKLPKPNRKEKDRLPVPPYLS